jgi:hypothetical protein
MSMGLLMIIADIRNSIPQNICYQSFGGFHLLCIGRIRPLNE